MKEKLKSVILLFFISLILIPSFIYGASMKQKATISEPIQFKNHTSIAPEDEDINFPYISGYKDGTFKPNQPITREELATMLARIITKNQIPMENNQYDDLYEGRFSTDAVNYITQLGIMKPGTATTFQPNRKVSHREFEVIVQHIKPYIKNEDTPLPKGDGDLTRVEAVVALNKLFNVQCNTNHESFPFTDVKPGMDAYEDILCATQPKE